MAPTPRLTSALLEQPAQHAARAIAGAYLREVAVQIDAVAADPAAGVHDLRVALRRLRTWLRAYRPELDDTVGRKSRRRAAKIAEATNDARDIEATLEWIEAQELSARERRGARRLIERLQNERTKAHARARKVLERRATKLVARLSEQLRYYWVRRDVDDPAPSVTMARATSDALATHADRFARAVARVESHDDTDRIHRVRIAAKRVRYLLETIPTADAQRLAQSLSELQDVLGASHDMHGIVKRIVRELAAVGARDAREAARQVAHPDGEPRTSPRLGAIRPGLHALIGRARDRERETYEQFRAEWNADRVAATTADVRAVCDALTRL